MANCKCGEQYSDKRARLGWKTCLKCGEDEARAEANKRRQRVAVLVNKSSYQYICSEKDLQTMGKR